MILGNKKFFTLTEVASAIRRLKSGQTPGQDEIRPEMLKALNGEGVSDGIDTWKTPNDWQAYVIIPTYKKGVCKERTNYRGISPSAF